MKAQSRTAHMGRRRAHGLTYAQVGKEFGVSKSTAHRRLNSPLLDNDPVRERIMAKRDKADTKRDILRNGYITLPMGKRA